MKRSGWLIVSFILLDIPCYAESLAGYYLRYVRPAGIFESLVSLVYVFCGFGSLFSLIMVYKKMQEGDHEAGQKARQWCLSLFLAGVCTFIISTLADGYRVSDTLNIDSALRSTTLHINGSYETYKDFVYVICGIIGLIVLPEKFYALQNGDKNAGRSLTYWGLGLLATVVMVFLLHKIYFP